MPSLLVRQTLSFRKKGLQQNWEVPPLKSLLIQTSPNLSLVSALLPSPDWFVGVSGLSLLDESGAFVSELVVDLEVYDAGTDSGFSFNGPNFDSVPRETISLLGDNPNFLPSFLAGFGTEIPGVASLTLRRISE